MDADRELEGFEVLSRQQCGMLLTRGCVGRVGFVVGGRPQVLPVNYAADDAGVVVVIRWAPGHRQRWFAITPEEITGRRLPVQGMAEGLGGWYPGVPS